MSRPKKGFQNRDDNDTTNVDFTQLMGGIVSLLLIVLMCVIVAVLNGRRRRRISQDDYEAAAAAEQAIIKRKHSLNEKIRFFVLESGANEIDTTRSKDELSEDQLASLLLIEERNIMPEEIIGTDCPICIQEYKEGDVIGISHDSDCAHIFHKDCIVNWLSRNDRCPTCRRIYMKEKK